MFIPIILYAGAPREDFEEWFKKEYSNKSGPSAITVGKLLSTRCGVKSEHPPGDKSTRFYMIDPVKVKAYMQHRLQWCTGTADPEPEGDQVFMRFR